MYAINHEGKLLWENESFLSREVRSIYTHKEKIYVPTLSNLYQLSSVDGHVVETIVVKNLLTFLGDYMIVIPGEVNEIDRGQSIIRMEEFAKQNNIISLVDFDQNSELFEITPKDPYGIADAYFSRTPFVDKTDHILMVYNSANHPSRIEAYQIPEGNLVWTLEKSFLTPPIIIHDYIITYSDALEVYNSEHGTLVARIDLKREDSQEPTSVGLTGYEDIVVISFRDTWEVVALQIDFSQLQQ